MSVFNLPDAGEGLTEALIVTWHVKAGDTVAVNDVLLEIETAKSIVELPSPFAGVVGELLVLEGETVPVGTPLVSIGGNDEPEAVAEAGDEPKREPVLVGYGPKATSAQRRRGKVSQTKETPIEQNQPSAASSASAVLAKPPVRKLAKDLGVDLSEVRPHGDVITRADVEAAAKRSPNSSRDADRIDVIGVRKTTADSVTTSAFSAPHVTVWTETDVTATVELHTTLRQRYPNEPISMLTVVGRAVIAALKNHPMLNSTWRGDHIDLHTHVDLGFAAATERGLLVAHVDHADDLSFVDFAREIDRLKAQARTGKATPSELVGGTFTITNVGVFDIDGGTPILVPGQSGILSMGRIAKKPWVVGEEIVPRDVMTLALSFDHRVVDGEQGSKFLADLAKLLANPGLALAF